MFLSKFFGYALRGILYVALMQDEKRKVQIDEIANKLSVPRHSLLNKNHHEVLLLIATTPPSPPVA